jgi:hypothetical protein
MSKIIPGKIIIELNEDQIKAIDWFIDNPPKYYKFFYKLWKKVLPSILFLSLVACFVLAIIHVTSRRDLFDVIKYIFFADCGLALWALLSHLYKVFYTKKYAKKIGLTLKEWDWVTIGMKWDI